MAVSDKISDVFNMTKLPLYEEIVEVARKTDEILDELRVVRVAVVPEIFEVFNIMKLPL